MALSEDLLLSSKLYAAETGATLLLNGSGWRNSFLIASDKDTGVSSSIILPLGRTNVSAGVKKIWHRANKQDLATFDPIAKDSTMARISASTNIAGLDVSLIASLNRQENDEDKRNYSLVTRHILYKGRQLRIDTSASYSQQNDDHVVYLTLTATLNHGNWNNQLDLSSTQTKKVSNGKTTNTSTSQINLSNTWRKTSPGVYRAKGALNIIRDSEYQQENLKMNYSNNFANFNADIARNQSNEKQANTQYKLGFNTSLILTPHDLSISNATRGHSGFLIDVESLHDNDKFETGVCT